MTRLDPLLSSTEGLHGITTQLRLWIPRVFVLIVLGIFSFCTPPILLTLGSYVYFQATDEIFPGIGVGELDLGGLSKEEATQVIQAEWQEKDDIEVVVRGDLSRSWMDRASAFGLSVDAEETASNAYRLGREGEGFAKIINMLSVLRSGGQVDYAVSLDLVQAKSQVELWAKEVFVPSVPDHLALDGRQLIVQPARDGRSVDVLATLQFLVDNTFSVLVLDRQIPLATVPVLSEHYATDGARDRLSEILATDPRLEAYDPVTDEHFVWRPDDDHFSSWFDIKPEEGEFKVSVIEDHIMAFVEEVNSQLGEGRRIPDKQALADTITQLSGGEVEPLKVEHLSRSYVVAPGDNLVSISFSIGMPYWKLYEVNPDLARQGLVVGEELIIPPLDAMLTLPIIPEKRIVISILEQRMWVYEQGELIHEYIVSTGIPSSPTLPGIYQVNSHYENAYASIWNLYMPHFLGIYDAVPGFTNGIHGLPLLSSGRRLWADVLGNPASYGCIILDLNAAEQLFYWAEEGVVVEIRE